MNADIDKARVSSRAFRTFLPNAPQRVWDHRFYTRLSLAIATVVFAFL